MKKSRRFFIFSACLSVLLHLGFLITSYFLWVPGVEGVQPAIEKMFQVKPVERIRDTPSARQSITQNYVEKIKFEKPQEEMRSLIEEAANAAKPVGIPEGFQPAMPAEIPLERAPLDPVMPAPEFKEEISIEKRNAAELPKAPDADLFVPTAGGEAKNRPVIRQPSEFLETPAAGSGAEKLLRELGGPILPSVPLTAADRAAGIEAFTYNPSHEPLDQFLSVSMQTWQDPSDGQKYYRLSVFPSRNQELLEVMPKEIIFLVDASLSIQSKRLREFKKGIQYALQNLNPEDRFNIFVFKNEIIPFADRSAPAEPRAVAAAMQFLDDLQPSRTTDIYTAFLETMEKKTALHPSYIVLLSDGKPTEGLQSGVQLIQEISRRNRQQRPIFAFSGGWRVDRFLLDFLTYPNRGWAEYTRQDYQLAEKFQAFYNKIRNPILINVNYQVSPMDETEAFPRSLPDFYRDSLFTIYGKYDQESRFSIRIVGEIADKTKEFIFTSDLKHAAPGTRDIARFWAFNKVFDLISRMTLEGSRPEYREEIRRLVEKFELEVPYEIDRML